MKPRFKVKSSGAWITCHPLNEEAREVIHGKAVALWPGPKLLEPYISFEDFIKQAQWRKPKKSTRY